MMDCLFAKCKSSVVLFAPAYKEREKGNTRLDSRSREYTTLGVVVLTFSLVSTTLVGGGRAGPVPIGQVSPR